MVKQFIGLILFSVGIIGLFTIKTFDNNEIFKKISNIILSIFPIYLLFFIPIPPNTLRIRKSGAAAKSIAANKENTPLFR